jgi:GntR family transcriptional regulator / MocR family aminotransferase
VTTKPTAPTHLVWETLLDLSATRPGPLNRRLASAIRAAVKDGRLPLGAALPPSRTLAGDLRVSRWTVTEAYGQLVTEGYLTARTGSATRVNWSPRPDDAHVGRPVRAVTNAPPPPVRYDFYSGRSDLRAFPRRKWVEAIRVAAETASYDQLGRAEPGGHPRLRAVLAEHLTRSRGAAAEPDTTSIFAGAGQGMSQISHALLASGHRLLGMENPGSPRLWQAAQDVGLGLVPLPVDDSGLVVEALADHPEVRAVCVGAARQVALGVPLAPPRRAALLAWAREHDGLIIEDDYDAEFAFDGPALPTIQGSEPGRVFLLGSMSKTLSPAVSVGWVVAPRRWVPAVRTEYEISAMPTSLNQLALAHFMESGAYDRYLRGSRQRFRARRALLAEALRRRLPQCRVSDPRSGLDLVLELPPGSDADVILTEAERRDMQLCDLKGLFLDPAPGSPPRLLLGYGNLNDSVIEEAVGILADVIASHMADNDRPGPPSVLARSR